MSPRCTQPAPGRARTQTGISRAPVQSKALSKMTGHFLNSCGRYTKNFAFDPSPFERQGKERKESFRGGLLSPLPVVYKQPLIQRRSVKSLVAVPGSSYLGWSRSWMSWQGAVQSAESGSPPRGLRSQREPSAMPPTHCRFWHLLGAAFQQAQAALGLEDGMCFVFDFATIKA